MKNSPAIEFQVESVPQKKIGQHGKWVEFRERVRSLPAGQCAVFEADARLMANIRQNVYKRNATGERWHAQFDNGVARVWVEK